MEEERLDGDRARGGDWGVWEKGHMSARAKESQIEGGGNRESAELSHKKKQDWVWQVPRGKQQRENTSASRTVKNASTEVASLSGAWYAQGKKKRVYLMRNTLHACRPRVSAVRDRPNSAK